jgi:hypothetical protein
MSGANKPLPMWRAILRLAFTSATVVLLYTAIAWSLCSYLVACTAADQYMSTATDGPWQRAKVGFVLDVALADVGWFDLPVVPHWVFRFQNPRTGNESKRVYVTVAGDLTFSYGSMLDPLPWLGWRP